MRFEYGRTTGYGSFTDRRRRRLGHRRLRAGLDRARRLRPNTRYHFRAVATNATGHHAQPRPLVPDAARADRHQHRARPQPGRVGRQDLTVVGRISGTAVGGTRVALERQGFPFQSGFTEVATQDREAARARSASTSARCSRPRTSASSRAPRRPIASSIRTASSAVKVGLRAASWAAAGRASRARSGRACRTAACRCKKRSPRGRWASSSARRRRRSTRTARATVHRQAHPQAGPVPRRGARARTAARTSPAARSRCA